MKKLIYALFLIPISELAHAQVVTTQVTASTPVAAQVAAPAPVAVQIAAPAIIPAPTEIPVQQVVAPTAPPAQVIAPVEAPVPQVALPTVQPVQEVPAVRTPAQEAAPVPVQVAPASTPVAKATPAVPTDVAYGLKNPDFKMEPFAQLQGWGVYSMDRRAQNDADRNLDGTDQRANFFFRRARLGFRGKPYKDLTYTLSLYYDNVGHDSMAATRGTTNPNTVSGRQTDVTRSVAAIGLWDSFLTWKVSKSDLFHVTAGYFRPQISRESLTAAFNVNSFEKAPSQNYVRQSVIGRGFGRATGVNIGGMKHADKFGYAYNLGAFNKVTTSGTSKDGSTTINLGETQGDENALVYVGRLELTFGDAELDKYGFGKNINYFGKRKGITIALNGSSQDRTPLYRENKVVGGDILFNYGNWNIDSEFFYIYKKGNQEKEYSKARTGHFRMGYNIVLENGTILEPAAMVSGFYGETGSDYIGRDTVYDVGLNWYLDQNKYKFYVHYVKQDGDGDNLQHKDGGANNAGFHYGDYAGVGLTLQI